MILDTTTRSIEVILAGAITTNQLNVTAEWVDMTASATTGGATTANTNNTTAVTVVAAPAASTQRRVLGMSIYNADTVAATVTVRYNDNATIYPIIKIAIPAGYTLQYTDTAGWYTLDLTATKVGPTGATGATGPTGPTGATGAVNVVAVNDQTGTSYTLVLTDNGKDIRCTNASAITLTVPPNSSVAFPIGTVILFSQGGAGVVTATAGAGVNPLQAAWGVATSGIYDIRGLEKLGTDTWRVV